VTPAATNVIPLGVDIDPRDQGPEAERERYRQRYRIYAVRDGESRLMATTPDEGGIGTALVTLAEEGEFEDAAVGVLDTKGAPRGSGVWIVNPYANAS